MKNLRKIMALILVMGVVVSTIVLPVKAEDLNSLYGEPVKFDFDASNSYQNYLERYKNLPSPNVDISIPGVAKVKNGDGEFKVVSAVGKDNVLCVPNSVTWVEWNVNVQEEGLYNVGIVYALPKTAQTDITFSMLINGETPFNQASKFAMFRTWFDSTDVLMDSRGNNLRPKTEQMETWSQYNFNDFEGYYQDSFKFKLNSGTNTIRINTNGQGFYIDSIKILNEAKLPTYSQVADQYAKNAYKDASATPIKFQAEKTFRKSHSTIYPVSDKTTPATEPSDPSKIRLNILGGINWQTNAYWASWEFDAPSDGLYEVSLKYRQNLLSGLFTSRNIYVDDKIPFQELKNVRFQYCDDWVMKTLGNSEKPYKFYFKKGKHTLKMEVTFGDLSNVIRKVNDDVVVLNELYRKIIMISGSSPDQYRDYQFEKQIPELLPTLEKMSEDISKQINNLRELSGSNGSELSTLQRILFDIDTMRKDPQTIKTRLTTFKSNVGSLSAWLFKVTSQPLEFDYIVVHPDKAKLQSSTATAWESFNFGLNNFFASFYENYSVIAQDGKNSRKVKVWVGLGRDQVGIIKDMVLGEFTPKTNIDIQLELVQGSLIEATLAGRGPDIALMVPQAEPVNYAIRGALVDLKQFKDFDGFIENFYPSATIPFMYRGGCYGLPDTQTFDMLFYRKDILRDLGLGVPNTWDQLNRAIPIIKNANMEIGITNALNPNMLYPALLYQRGGKYYNDDLRSTAFDSEAAKEAFKQLTDYFVSYEFPMQFDFYSRFRTGEMPMAIQGYTEYNRLTAAAPEIKGLWGMAPMPGTVKADGTIDRQTSSTISACTMFKKTKDKEAAWEFMKWFTSSDIQARYGIELEKIMGPAARYSTANKGAFSRLPWTLSEQELLKKQWDQVVAIPELPGSYYTPRGLSNAFKSAAISFENPYEQLHKQNVDINNEIARKYKEFGLDK